MRNNVIRSLVRDIMHMLPNSEVKTMTVRFVGDDLVIGWNEGKVHICKDVIKAMKEDSTMATLEKLATRILTGQDNGYLED